MLPLSRDITVDLERPPCCPFPPVLLVCPPSQNVNVCWLDTGLLELAQLQLRGILVDKPLVALHVVRDAGQEG